MGAHGVLEMRKIPLEIMQLTLRLVQVRLEFLLKEIILRVQVIQKIMMEFVGV